MCSILLVMNALPAAVSISMTAGLFESVSVAPVEHFRSNAFPTVDRLADDRLLCVFSAHDRKTGDKDVIASVVSADNGKTWTRPSVLIDSPGELDFDPSVIVIGPRVIVTSTTCPLSHLKFISTSRTMAVRSEDSGKTWSKPYEIAMGHRFTAGKINKGIVTRDGTALFGFSWDINLDKGIAKIEGEGRHELVASVMVSSDRGMTWKEGGQARLAARKDDNRRDAINGTDEPAVVECGDGTLYMLCRTGLEKLYECRSRDGGKTWSPAAASALTSHNSPAALCAFTGKRPGMLAVWCNSPKSRWPLCAAASFDNARTWTPPRRLAMHEGYQSSYPGCTQTADGSLLVVWQQDRPDQKRAVEGARFDLEWLLAKDQPEAMP